MCIDKGGNKSWKMFTDFNEEFPYTNYKDLPKNLYGHLSGFTVSEWAKEKHPTYHVSWDSLRIYDFKGIKIYQPITNTADVILYPYEKKHYVFIVGRSDVLDHVKSKLNKIFGEKRIKDIVFTRQHLDRVLEKDAVTKKIIWWAGVETGLDGALKGSIPDVGHFVDEFESRGQAYYARYESAYLGATVSISLKKKTLSSQKVDADTLLRYFFEVIFPVLQEDNS